MKKILQALDGASSKPVEGSNDMKKFMSIVNEGANPHKVALPVQMAMQHYQQPAVEKKSSPIKDSAFKKYYQLAEDEIIQRKEEKREKINQYASIIAERVRLKESGGEGKWHTSPSGAKTNMPPTDDDYEINYGEEGLAGKDNPTDEITVDVPLLIRLLEYAREDAQGDIDLHDVAERMIELSGDGRTLTMDDYNTICNTGDQELPRPANQDNQED